MTAQRQPFAHLRLFFATALLPLVITLGAIYTLNWITRLEQSERQQQDRELLETDLQEISDLIARELNSALYFTSALHSYIEASQGQMDSKAMEPWLLNLQTSANHIRNIGLAPDNRISFIFPLKGNEGAIGLRYEDLPEQWQGVREIIESHQGKLVGPVFLKQGGQGLIYREPIYLENGSYWGIVSTVIDADSLFKALRQNLKDKTTPVIIRDLDTGQLVWGTPATIDGTILNLPLNVPGRHLQLEGLLADPGLSRNIGIIRIGGIFISLLLGFSLWRYLMGIIRQREQNLALRQEQERFDRAFNASPLGIGLLAPDRHWLDVNTQLTQMLQLDKTTLLNLPLQELFTQRDWEKIDAQMQLLATESLPNQRAFSQLEVTLNNGDNHPLLVLLSLALYNQDQQGSHWIIQVTDLSERARMERLKDEFVSTVSHELRTPLTAIVGGIKLLGSGALGEVSQQAGKILKIAQQNADKLTLIINDLLDINKLIAGKMEFDNQLQPLAPIVTKAVDANQPYADQYRVKFVFQPSADDVEVKVDANRLQQVLANLLSNAAKFSPANSQVEIGIELLPATARVFVQDHGPGITQEDQLRLFNKFTQLDGSSTRKVGGSGLGLAISKEIVKRLQGELGVKSAPGEGARFYIDLPR